MSDIVDLPARLLACGWLNVSQGWSNDEGRPALYRAVLVEEHDQGVLLVTTDSTILMTAWVPFALEGPAEAPGWDEAPQRAVLVSDGDERAVAMCRWLWKITKPPKGLLTMRAELAECSLEDPDQPTLTPEMAREALALRTDVERVALPIVDQPFPEWRSIIAGHEQKATRRLIVSPEMMARLGKIVGVGYGSHAIELGLCGPLGPVSFTVKSDTPVRGLFMPLRDPDADES